MAILIGRALKMQSLQEGKRKMFTPEALQSSNIAANQTGVLLSVPEVAGKVYKINVLCVNSTSTQEGMSLVVNGVTISSDKALMSRVGLGADTNGSGFGVSGIFRDDTNASRGARGYHEIYCTSFSLIKGAGNTGLSIAYAYEIGSYK